jgi:hypothetical protein
MPLDKLAERTGLDPGTCSKHLQKLATYRTPDDQPILHVETVEVPRQVDQTPA